MTRKRKLTAKEEEYMRWKEQRDAKREEKKQDGSKTKTIKVEDGDSVIWIHGEKSKGIEISLVQIVINVLLDFAYLAKF